MAVSGFEGFEKRLELQFSGDDPVSGGWSGLRKIRFETLEEVLRAVQCTVVSAVGNRHLDAYVLSESSLFVYPTKIIIKTCGTTQLLKSVRPLIRHAADLGLTICLCRYTRGSFIFPKSQPFPHSNFKEEVIYLEQNLPTHDSLPFRKASVMPSKIPSHSWHVFSATNGIHGVGVGVGVGVDDDHDYDYDHDHRQSLYTIEVCMTELDPISAGKFFRQLGDGGNADAAGRAMTEAAGIVDINPRALVCDVAFDPCGYSMNGVDGARYSTIHVTPEDGYSYASFECVGSIYDGVDDVARVLRRVVQVFRPGTVSVSTTTRAGNGESWTTRFAGALEPLGLKCRSVAVDEFPASGRIAFQMFTSRRK